MINITTQGIDSVDQHLVTFLENVASMMMNKLGYHDFDVSIILCDSDFIHDLNRRYRDKDMPTDILSFPMFPDLVAGEKIILKDGDCKDLGDLIIFLERIKQDASELQVPFLQYFKKILAHGLAHLLGYSHYTEEANLLMLPLEAELVDVCKDL